MGIKSYAFGLSSDVQANCQWLFGGKCFASLFLIWEEYKYPYDLAEKKTEHLEDLYRITNTEVLITGDVVTLTANYRIGITDLQFILLCGANKDKHGKLIDNCLVPYSFRIEDISSDKFGELYEVDFIFCKQTNDSTYSTLSYKGNKEIEEIPEEIRAKISESIK